MADLVQLRLAGQPAFAWYALDRTVARPLGCGNCHRRIEPGEPHARAEFDGKRVCGDCVQAAERGQTMASNEANRRQRRDKLRWAAENAVRMLLDGLEVGSIGELKRLVDDARPTAERRYMVDRAGMQSAAIGMARLALQHGDPEKAARVLDDAVENLHRQHFDACVEDGYPPEKVELLLGPRDRS